MKKVVIWILVITIVIILIPFLIITINKEEKKEPLKIDFGSSKEVSVYNHKTDQVFKMTLEEYITGVVAAEMPASFEKEALKAQAVTARTYTISKINAVKEADDAHKGADICTNPAHCQAYIFKDEAYNNWQENSDKYYQKIADAVLSTKGEILVYDNQVVRAVFHSSNSGQTESSKDIWGGDFPYLQSVKSYGEELAPKFKSTVTVDIEEFRKKILDKYPEADFTKHMGNITYTDGGSVAFIEIGGIKIKGTTIRSVFGLRSSNFVIKEDETTITFEVTGNGHGVGMSQYGANFMASEGKTYINIIENYYPGTSIYHLDE